MKNAFGGVRITMKWSFIINVVHNWNLEACFNYIITADGDMDREE